MAKLETPAAIPAAPRPPRPAVRMRAASPSAPSTGRPEVDDDAADERASAYRPGGEPSSEEGPDVVEVLEVEDYEPSGSDRSLAGLGAHAFAGAAHLGGQGFASDASSDEALADEAITERGFDASTFGLPRTSASQVPMANLEMPSGSRLDLTPSPVPRVALSPATGSVDISLVPGPHASRNLPTLAAYHAFGRRPVRRPAAAITFPPPRRGAPDAPRLGMGLAKDVRSSKREIVLGLAIGLGLSLVLAAVGHSYLREVPVASAPPPELESLTLSARPESAPAPSNPAAPSPVARTSAASSSPGPVAGSLLAAAHTAVPADRGGAAPAAHLARKLAVDPSARELRASLEPVSGSERSLSGERSSEAAARGVPSRAVARRAHARGADAAPAAPGTRRGAGSDRDSVPSFEEPAPRAPLPPALSPAESAGLGLDLPL